MAPAEPCGPNREWARYLEYKDSGVEWPREIPGHWKVRRLGQIGSVTKCSGGPKSDEASDGVPCIRYGDLYIQYDAFITGSRALVSRERASQYSTTRYGDLLFAASGETIEEIGRAAVNLMDGDTRCGGDIVLLRPGIEVSPRFLGYTGNAPYMAFQKSRVGRGITVMHIYGNQLKELLVFLPPVAEQRAIADFLDIETAKVSALIAKQHELISLLQEKRTALISHVVTKGLDPNVTMKDTGVEWLGEIPAHWEVGRLKTTVSECQNGVWGRDPDGTNDVACIRVADFDRDTFSVDSSSLTLRHVDPRAFSTHRLGQGDLLLEKSGGGERQPVGAVVIVADDLPAVCSNFVARMPVNDGHSPVFLVYLHAVLYSSRINVRSIKQSIGIQNLDSESYLNELVGLPPVVEQRSISTFLDGETAVIDELIAKANDAITHLDEYRIALISAAVTGRIDVSSHLQSETAPNIGSPENVP